jgi:ribosomal-protein-serine acetyltransferase
MQFKYAENNIIIRPYQESDIDDLFEAAYESRSQIYPWLVWCHPNYSRDESKSWILSRPEAWKADTDYSFAIREKQRDRYLGGVGFNLVNRLHSFCNLGYWIRSSATGKGIATAAVQLAAKFGFAELKLNRLEILVAIDNTASQKVAEKAGALREGILRKRLLVHGKAHDAVMYSLTVPD